MNPPDVQSRLPAPDPGAAAHSARLELLVAEEIAARGGALPFERFMELVLYAPGLGYYSSGTRKLGPAGDFVTAPEVSELYSRCVANQCAQIAEALGGAAILELGAGSGAMAADTLLELDRLGAPPERYFILEVSADLRDRQRALLAERAGTLAQRVTWLDRLPEEPLTGTILANEVLDALPVERFRIDRSRPDGVAALAVAAGPDGLAFTAAAAGPALRDAVAAIETSLGTPLPDGYESEYCPRLAAWLSSVTACLARGAMVIVDYGLPRREYYAAERMAGTLQCHYRHRMHGDPLAFPGLQDVSAWVDFTAVAAAAVACGLRLAGFTTQMHFLVACDLAGHLERALAAEPARQPALVAGVKRLTLPGEMGERFRVMGLTRDCPVALRGFAGRDLSGTL